LVLLLHRGQLRLPFGVQPVLGVRPGELLHGLLEPGAVLGGDRTLVLLVAAPVGAQVGVVGRRQRVLPQAVEITRLDQVDRGLHRRHRAAATGLRGVVLAVAGAEQQHNGQGQQGVAQESCAHGWVLVVDEDRASLAAPRAGRVSAASGSNKGCAAASAPPAGSDVRRGKRNPAGVGLAGKSG